MTSAPEHTRWTALAYLGVCALCAPMWFLGGKHVYWVLLFVLLASPAPFIVMGLWWVKRPAWFALHIHAAVLVGAGAFIAANTATLALPAIVMGAAAATVSVVFLRADARMPYLSADTRGFRRFERFRRALPTVVVRDGYRIRGESFDISDGGAYVVLDPRDFQAGQRVQVELEGRDKMPVTVSAKVVSGNREGVHGKPPGVSVRFLQLGPSTRDSLHRLISRSRHHQRVPLVLPVRMTQGSRTLSANTYDMSVSGCFVASLDQRLSLGEKVKLTLTLHESDSVDMLAEVVWRRELGRGDKPAGVALRFLGVTPDLAERLRNRLFERQTPLVGTFV